MKTIVDVTGNDAAISFSEFSKGTGLKAAEIIKLILEKPQYIEIVDTLTLNREQAMLLISILPNDERLDKFKNLLLGQFNDFEQAIKVIQQGRKLLMAETLKNKEVA